MELDDIVAQKLREAAEDQAGVLMSQAVSEANKVGAPDTIHILSLLKAVNILKRICHGKPGK